MSRRYNLFILFYYASRIRSTTRNTTIRPLKPTGTQYTHNGLGLPTSPIIGDIGAQSKQ